MLDLRRLALSTGLLLTLPARADGPGAVVTLDVNGGVPKLESNEFRLMGDGTVAVAADDLGAALRGAFAAYDAQTRAAISDSTRASASLEPWLTSGGYSAPLRFELRAVAEVAFYDSTYIPRLPPAEAGFFHDEDSLMWRGDLLAGVRARPGPRFFIAARLGGGVQYETYDYVKVDPNDPTVLTSTDNTSLRGRAQLRTRWLAAPDVISLRGRLDATFFSITRDDLAVRLDQLRAGATVTSSRRTLRQIEAGARLFVDADALALVGLRPAAFLGVDLFRLRGDAGATTSIVPVAGIGLFGFPGASKSDHDFE
jgi:hypothetical protein